ncbi:unnamed protein product [Orchesella dallaii]|uniref:Protein AATF n=1 Tax=Orchesella dallaii TaxID=48710 RepID=A0ABP1QB71_9HEXA
MAKNKLSLGEKIALAASGSHDDEFPEDIEYETSAKVPELDDDLEETAAKPTRSTLRTKNIQLLDELDTRYAGTKVTRRKFAKSEGLDGFTKHSSTKPLSKRVTLSSTEDEGIDGTSSDDNENDSVNASDEEEVDSMEDGGYDDDAKKKITKKAVDEEEDESGDENSIGSESDASDDDEDVESAEGEEDADEVGMQTLSLQDKEAEIEKGKATLNQLRIWDSLLEVRIRLQKMLLDCNRLPRTDEFQRITEEGDSSDNMPNINNGLVKSQESIKVLMHELMHLQSAMIQKNSEAKKAIKTDTKQEEINEDPLNEEITSEDSDAMSEDEQPRSNIKRKVSFQAELLKAKKRKIEDFMTASQDVYNSFIPFRNQTIQKWNDKTQFAGGKFNRKTASQQISTLKQIEQILSNKERLLKRTQVRRSNYEVIGNTTLNTAQDETLEKTDPEIFDDDDFYHQLLRELIERKTSNINDPVQLSHHWLELQKLRSKLKRKVDTKASKGRKIRYDVHSKLVNFMAPQENCTMSAAAVKELFSSLFGKMKE